MHREIELWRRVLGDSALIERALAIDASDVTAVAALRRQYSSDVVSAALDYAAGQRKAIDKFGGSDWVADVAGVEQASGPMPAAYKARRMHEVLGADGQIADLCCGVGGDSRAMIAAGLRVMSVDRDPLRAWMAGQNAQGTQAICADVESLELEGVAIHIDPARRNEGSGKRAWRLEDYQPGPDVIGRLIERAPASAVKLSPGVDVDALPWRGELEFISEAGRLVQAVLWTGAFAGASRRATLLVAGSSYTLHGEPDTPTLGGMQRYLYTFDASVERAGLIGQLCKHADAPAVHAKLGLLTSDRVIDSPWLTGFELIERLPWRPKRVRQWLMSHDGGLVEVKTRGKACDPDAEQLRLRGPGSTRYTVFVLRFDTKVEALITRRL